ncbi:hypothetical protein OSB04_un000666 [Centaurea solstitialis]|uniref:Uncharacterized protein n=1 Tax=Centaurea solstitialis TaxID=347529 RepID=A0AA38W2E7_9ASTR|nr:hypothetical protein OSB04_un000666 [Centaurea solstitialis]
MAPVVVLVWKWIRARPQLDFPVDDGEGSNEKHRVRSNLSYSSRGYDGRDHGGLTRFMGRYLYTNTFHHHPYHNVITKN